MLRRSILVLAGALMIVAWFSVTTASAQQGQVPAQQAYGRQFGQSYNTQDWNRFYHYPYVYYPQNYWSADYYRSSQHMYNRYPPEMQVPTYNPRWHNYYPQARRYHKGHHFILDVF